MAKTIFTKQHQDFIRALREVRRSKGVTQVQLSERLDRAQSYISNIERGERRIDVIEFMAIAAALNRDAAELFSEIVTRMNRPS
ncbi:helix-turn-helix transcriptional regulator [Rhizorhapis sp.]|uniref:helix-turn-helix domain-containing protein n=1 Tax=Rhizorhapis sp. TaxID=1968842 RepID=UPI002B499805|nr:helix-turn-helix transcriptional regulator [Rhizorhapis sp.]HKR16517.1 helix-turn-helix transcriptional regulator [Rhizorhapis sp.]